jgi:hypothetical protein
MTNNVTVSNAAVTVTGAKKIRVTSAIPTWLQIAELQAVQAITGINVALASNGATAVGSGNYGPASTPDKTIDGIFPAEYPDIYHSNGAGADEFLEITLAAPADLASLTLYGRAAFPMRDFYAITIFNDVGATLFSGQLDNRALSGGGNTLTFDVAPAPAVAPPAPTVASSPPAADSVEIVVEGKRYLITILRGTWDELGAKLQTNPWYDADHNRAAMFALALKDKLGYPNWDGSPQNRVNHHPPYFVYWTSRFDIKEPRRVRFFIEPTTQLVDFTRTLPEEHNMRLRSTYFSWAHCSAVL